MNKLSSFLMGQFSKRKREKLMFYDLLTGVYNRNWLEFHKEFLENNELYIIFLDMNSVKKINDKYGHKCGDEAIIVFFNLLKAVFSSPNDYIIRYGGDEAVVFTKGEDWKFELLKSFPDKYFSYGIVFKTKKVPISKGISDADSEMYTMKERFHQIANREDSEGQHPSEIL